MFKSNVFVGNGSFTTVGNVGANYQFGEFLEFTKNFSREEGIDEQFKRDLHFLNVFDPQNIDLI